MDLCHCSSPKLLASGLGDSQACVGCGLLYDRKAWEKDPRRLAAVSKEREDARRLTDWIMHHGNS